MKSTYSDVPNLSEDWEFWFSRNKKIDKNTSVQTRDSYCFIMNSETSCIDYVSESVFDVLGYTAEEFDIDKVFSVIHPDDLEYCRLCEEKSLKVNNNFLYNEHFQYSFHYSYRMKAKSGLYITILQRYEVIEVDKEGRLYKTLVMHQKIDDYVERPVDDFRIYDKLKGRSINIPNEYKLTKRELEILELIYQGYKSTEISEMLYLSKNTVNTHRKNILQKTKSNSWVELVSKSK